MPTSPAQPGVVLAPEPATSIAIHPSLYFSDVYTFDWSAFRVRLPLVSASAVALALFLGVAVGHPAAGLIAGGGALTVGFGANQRIADSRLWPMILAIVSMALATLTGTVAGHESYAIVIASAVAAAIYGVLSTRHAGLAWVGQQAAVSLFVASAFPTPLKPALERAGLILLGGTIQLVLTSAGLRLMPELRRNLLELPRSLYAQIYEQRREWLERLRGLPGVLPALTHEEGVRYGVRLLVSVSLASWAYQAMGLQSGYWVPMTTLLVQKPSLSQTTQRVLTRVLGTLAGATVATHLAAHLPLSPWWLAGLASFFAFWCFATNSVNYGLFSLSITSYIVFLLSLNEIPGPEIATRRALCTLAGAVIAVLVHVDSLRRAARPA
jgi:hypothetical protein